MLRRRQCYDMQVKSGRILLFIAVLLSAFSSASAAAVSNSSLQGAYVVVLQKIDTPVGNFLAVMGAASFDGAGRVNVQGSVNRNGDVQGLSSSGTYTLGANGSI